jgi:hypothetical protein
MSIGVMAIIGTKAMPEVSSIAQRGQIIYLLQDLQNLQDNTNIPRNIIHPT